jgi:hypothetical protein
MRKIITAAFVLVLVYTPSRMAQQTVYSPPPASASVLAGIKFSAASPVNEAYRAEFDRCDKENIFKGRTMTGFRKCSGDPNRVKALLRFPDQTIFFESKLSLDIDGSQKACTSPGLADLCATWFAWDNLPEPQRYVDSDIYPYVVIPISGSNASNNKEFRNRTGINKGDLGVVVFKDKVVPVFVADGGPYNKLGEGSQALFKALGEDRCVVMSSTGHCEKYKDFSIPSGVLVFLFPNSKIVGLKPVNALEKIRVEALARFARLKQG